VAVSRLPLAARGFFAGSGAVMAGFGPPREGVWFGSATIIPWRDVRSVFESGIQVKGHKASGVAFEFHRKSTLFRTPVEHWISSTFAVGDIDLSPPNVDPYRHRHRVEDRGDAGGRNGQGGFVDGHVGHRDHWGLGGLLARASVVRGGIGIGSGIGSGSGSGFGFGCRQSRQAWWWLERRSLGSRRCTAALEALNAPAG
jgi:hypothetical protein